MQLKPLQELLKQAKDIKGEFRFDEPLANYTSWKVGGKAECIFRPGCVADLQILFSIIPAETAINWLGLGSNVLVRDGGLKGIVINTNGVLNRMDIRTGNNNQGIAGDVEVMAQAGVSCAAYSRRVANAGLCGAEFLSGIPGTIGGALAMNAGAFGGETWTAVKQVEIINRQGQVKVRPAKDFNVGYRTVNKASDEWFLSADFCYPMDAEKLAENKKKIRNLLDKRARTQPIGLANAGSVFKNPEGDYAARLIEDCGLKGLQLNGAQVSEKHANFIINNGKASATAVEQLIELIQTSVNDKYGINLQTEIKIIGESRTGESI